MAEQTEAGTGAEAEVAQQAGIQSSKVGRRAPHWRRFVFDYVIVVLGVLTALGAQELADDLHWRQVSAAARESSATTSRFLVRDAAEREAQMPCVAAQLRALRGALDRASASGRLEPIASVRNPARRAWTFNPYDTVVSSGLLPHLPADERRRLTAINNWSGYLQRNREVEVRAWSVLRTMEGPGRPIGEAELAALRTALSEAIYQAGVMRGGARDMAQRLAESNIFTQAEFARIWAQGVEDARDGACATRTTGDTEILLRQLETPLLPPPTEDYWPPNWPNGAG